MLIRGSAYYLAHLKQVFGAKKKSTDRGVDDDDDDTYTNEYSAQHIS